jgi:hypothetical protein
MIKHSKQQRPFRVKLFKHSKPINEIGELEDNEALTEPTARTTETQ